MNEKTKAILEKNPALRVLAEIDNGGTASELAHELTELVQAAAMTGKKGKLTLEIQVKPTGAGKMEIEAEVKPKAPKPTKHSTTFFSNERFELQRSDPNQKELQFSPAAAAAN